MRRFGALALGLGTSLTGCTWLISFDEVPPGADASAAGDGAAADAAGDAAEDAPETAPGCDPSFPASALTCERSTQSCAADAFASMYPEGRDPTNDLVTCNGTVLECVRTCDFGCAVMPSGFPDECDECSGRADGFHCGRDLPDWDARNADLAVECKGGKTVGAAVCGAGKCASACPRAGGPTPACCVP
jgi:hypothetical protein